MTVSLLEEEIGKTDMYTGKATGRHRKKIYKPRGEASEETEPANTWVSGICL